MVTTSDEQATQHTDYRRRQPWPALVILLVLAVVVSVVWRQVLTTRATVVTALACPAPSTATAPAASAAAPGVVPAPTPRVTVDRAELAATTPAAPRDTRVRVLNANGQRGQAVLISTELTQPQLGFAAAADNPIGNDTVYTNQNMQCVGQIRFGTAGLAQARTLALAVPCAELVRDARTDNVVDLALGTTFGTVAPGTAAQLVLTALNAAPPGTPAAVNPADLAAATNASC